VTVYVQICWNNEINWLTICLFYRAFGHLDNVNTVIRSPGNPNITLSDAHVRFERFSEAKAKNSQMIEELLKNSFGPVNIESLPTSISELKGSQTTSWNHRIEQILLMRSLSFSEYEMLSNPILLLTVVASNEVDPVISMQDLLSSRYVPSCLETVPLTQNYFYSEHLSPFNAKLMKYSPRHLSHMSKSRRWFCLEILSKIISLPLYCDTYVRFSSCG